MKYRWEELLERLPAGPVAGAEIGVDMGYMSMRLLKRPDLTLYMVDPWRSQPSKAYLATKDYHATQSQAEHDRRLRVARADTAFAKERARIVRLTSAEAAPTLPLLDFVFIDADHSYEGVRDDILLWRQKIKPGGLLSGHDYGADAFGVTRAVNEIFGVPDQGADYTWFVRL